MSDATDADRERAIRVMAWDPLTYAGLAQAVEEGGDPDDRDSLETVDAIAAALAEERAKAREPFLALADDLEGRYLPLSSAAGQAWDIAAEIRAAAEATE